MRCKHQGPSESRESRGGKTHEGRTLIRPERNEGGSLRKETSVGKVVFMKQRLIMSPLDLSIDIYKNHL